MTAMAGVAAARKNTAFQAGAPVKGRNEPCHMRAVLDVVAAVKGLDPAALAGAVHANTLRLFFPGESAPAAPCP